MTFCFADQYLGTCSHYSYINQMCYRPPLSPYPLENEHTLRKGYKSLFEKKRPHGYLQTVVECCRKAYRLWYYTFRETLILWTDFLPCSVSINASIISTGTGLLCLFSRRRNSFPSESRPESRKEVCKGIPVVTVVWCTVYLNSCPTY